MTGLLLVRQEGMFWLRFIGLVQCARWGAMCFTCTMSASEGHLPQSTAEETEAQNAKWLVSGDTTGRTSASRWTRWTAVLLCVLSLPGITGQLLFFWHGGPVLHILKVSSSSTWDSVIRDQDNPARSSVPFSVQGNLVFVRANCSACGLQEEVYENPLSPFCLGVLAQPLPP